MREFLTFALVCIAPGLIAIWFIERRKRKNKK